MNILLETAVALFTIGLGVLFDYSLTKKPYDDARKNFNTKTHWWKWRKDNVLVCIVASGIAGLTSDLWAVPVINKYLEWPELAERMTELGAIVISCAFGYILFMKLLGWPPKQIGGK